jgi:hypothetical protein
MLKEEYGFRTEYPEHAVILRDVSGLKEFPVCAVAVGKDYRHANVLGSMIRARFPLVDVDRIPVLNPTAESHDMSRLSLGFDNALHFIEAVAEGKYTDPQAMAQKMLPLLRD